MKHLTGNNLVLLILGMILLFSGSCSSTDSQQISVSIQADNQTITLSLPRGTTVREALEKAEFSTGALDQVDPPLFSVLNVDTTITLSRVREEFEIETAILPFTRQNIHSESLPAGDKIMLQPGENGLEEITIRILFIDGVETSQTIANRVTLTPPRTEILMVGVQPSYLPVQLEGMIVYIDAGNAWMMHGTSHTKQPLVLTGDLDSRIFELSPDGKWLLYSRADEHQEGEEINSLWIISTDNSDLEPIDLKISNVVHFASWSPKPTRDNYQIAYSTVEPRSSSPGWQANNDLRILSLSPGGRLLQTEIVLEENPGGQYGWWGTFFSWSPDASRFAFTRADAIGLVDPGNPSFETLLEVVPFEVGNDYVWTPDIAWGPESQILYVHIHSEGNQAYTTQNPGSFSLLALDTTSRSGQVLLEQTGIFAYPTISIRDHEITDTWLILLTPVNAAQLMNTRYNLARLDTDGSNFSSLFPPDNTIGLEPYPPIPSPYDEAILFIHNQDLWLYNTTDEDASQLTGSGQVTACDWK
ncbi:MAG: G5 domain-containing protein [Anaerolineales bacterium]|nr:G5 domain-containing protein [Anaerolineales bacterium]